MVIPRPQTDRRPCFSKVGKLAYSVSLSNSIAGSDIGNSTNLHTDLATIVNLNYDILDPYGYKETDTTPGGPSKPQLSLWVSGMYNPVEYTSKWANDDAGEKTYGMTASLNYRYRNFGGQLSAYWKNNQPNGNASDYDSYGWGEQAGYYIVPGKSNSHSVSAMLNGVSRKTSIRAVVANRTGMPARPVSHGRN